MRKLTNVIFFGLFSVHIMYSLGVTETYRGEVYKRMEIDTMQERLKPTVLPVPGDVYDIAGIDIPNTVAIMNGKGEIALLSFDENLKPKVEVPVPGFPDGGMLYTDPEYRFAWARKGSGTYFLDTETKQTGHCVSMFMGSKVYQVVLADPKEKIWLILYGQMGGNLIDEFNLNENKKKSFDEGLEGFVYQFSTENLLVHSENEFHIRDWVFSSISLDKFYQPDENEITKKMTELAISVSKDYKKYSLRSRFMIGTTTKIKVPYFNGTYIPVTIRWNEKGETTITPLTHLHQPKDIYGLPFIGEFSSDGRWLDAAAGHVFNGIGNPMERFVYHVGDQYPAGMSPPIRLGLVEMNVKGAFMLHDTIGPCYVLLDTERSKNVLVYKLNEGLPIIAQQMASYIPIKK